MEEGAVLARKYRLLRTAGFGGMAQLWVALNQATGAEVCIKILVPEISDDESVQRFRREAYAAARLSHRAIVRIFDLVELGADGETTTGTPAALAIVMELLHGETLADHLMKRGKLPVDEALAMTLPFLSALGHAHRAGVVHRDLKPDNIFLAIDPDGHVIPKVLDFGVSKLSRAAVGNDVLHASDAKQLTVDGVMVGTPSYMSPEQARGSRSVDARSDVFSVGILLYMMLTGSNPFEGSSFHAVLGAVLERNPPRPEGLGDELWAVLERALAKEAADRYPDATELGIALRRATGRASITESGAHPVAALPASVRAIVPPLGGDSHVTVPPAGESEDAIADGVPRAASPAARRRAIRIVAAVSGASLALVLIAFLRAPAGSNGSSGGSPDLAGDSRGTNAGPNAHAGSSVPAATGAKGPLDGQALRPDAAAALAAPDVSTAAAAAAGAGTAAAAAAPPPAIAPPPATAHAPAPATARAPAPPTSTAAPRSTAPVATTLEPAREPGPRPPGSEPSIVRDPGF